MEEWWTLPGPRSFLARATDELRDGRLVLLLIPEWAPHGICDAVKEALQVGGYIDELPVDAAPPLVQLFRYGSISTDEGFSLPVLLRAPFFHNRVLWLRGVDATNWPAWREFLNAFQQVSRNQSVTERLLFVVALEGELALSPAENTGGLSVFKWDDCTSDLDMMLYSSYLLSGRPREHRQLLIATVAEIAQYDPEVAERLSREATASILSPTPLLHNIRDERGWATQPSAEWVSGGRMTVDGTVRLAFGPSFRRRSDAIATLESPIGYAVSGTRAAAARVNFCL